MDGLSRVHNFCPGQNNLELGAADKICLHLCPGLSTLQWNLQNEWFFAMALQKLQNLQPHKIN